MLKELKQDVLMNHQSSYLVHFLKEKNFTNIDILALLVIMRSLHQNTASFIMCNVNKCNVVSNTKIDFVIPGCDHRNFLEFASILQRYSERKSFNELHKMYLWKIQIYMLCHVYSCAYHLLFSVTFFTKDEIVNQLLNGISDSCHSIMSHGKKDVTDDKLLLQYVKDFVYLVFKIDYAQLRAYLLNVVEEAEVSYLLAVKDLRDVADKNVILSILTLVTYKAVLNRYILINELTDNVFSASFKNLIFPMIAPFGCENIATLPMSCKNNLELACELPLIDFYKSLFSMFYQQNVYDVYHEDDKEFTLAVLNDVCLGVRVSWFGLDNDAQYYNPYSCQMTGFVFFDVLLAFHEILISVKLNTVLNIEKILLLYKMHLHEKDPQEMCVILMTKLGRLNFFCNDNGKNKFGFELLCELLSMCYYAAFVKKEQMDLIKKCYNECSSALYKIESEVNNKKLAYEKYREIFCNSQKILHCENVHFLEMMLEQRLVSVLIENLLLNRVPTSGCGKLNLMYNVFLECRNVNELKVQQAAIMLCQTFRKYDGIIDTCSINTTGGIIMKLLFGNFLERALLIKLFNVLHLAYKNYDETKKLYSTEYNFLSHFFDQCMTILNLFKCARNNLSFDFSVIKIEDLDDDCCEVYSNISKTIDDYATRNSVSLSDLFVEQHGRYSADFIDLLNNIPVLHNQSSTVQMQVNPCNDLDRSACMMIIQLAISYVCLYDSKHIKKDLFAGEFYSANFLLFSILTYPKLIGEFVDLYNNALSIDSKKNSIQTKFNVILDALSSKEESFDFVHKSVSKISNVIACNVVEALINSDGSINVDSTILKNACFNIISLRKLNYLLCEHDVLKAYHADNASIKCTIDHTSLIAILQSMKKQEIVNTDVVENKKTSFSEVHKITDMMYDKEQYDKEQKEIAKTIAVHEPHNVGAESVGGDNQSMKEEIILSDANSVSEFQDDCVSCDSDLQSSASQVGEHEKDYNAKLHLDSKLCDGMQLDKKQKSQKYSNQGKFYCYFIVTMFMLFATFLFMGICKSNTLHFMETMFIPIICSLICEGVFLLMLSYYVKVCKNTCDNVLVPGEENNEAVPKSFCNSKFSTYTSLGQGH